MIRDDVYLGKCVYAFCDNEAHYTCDKCDDNFCKNDMKDNNVCRECGNINAY